MASDEVPKIVLESVDEPRRAFLRKLIVGSAFVVPSVASFSMTGLSVAEAACLAPNQTNQSFAGQNLHGQDLSGCTFDGDDFSQANLNGANLSSSTLIDCDFSGANLNNADLSNVNGHHGKQGPVGVPVNCDFAFANLRGADLTGADLSDCKFTGANLANADLTNADLFNSNFMGANFQNAVGLTTVTWGTGATCPDGTISGSHGNTCVGHLKPA
jgi:uncharacterized protein YjbI with pentapeptide repeats